MYIYTLHKLTYIFILIKWYTINANDTGKGTSGITHCSKVSCICLNTH